MAGISDDQKIKMYLAKHKDTASFIETLEDMLTNPRKERYGLTAYGRDLFSKVFGGDSKISRLLRNKYSDVWKGTIQRFRFETTPWTKSGRPNNAVRTVTRGSIQDKAYAYINRSIEPETGHRESASDASILLSDDFVPYGQSLSHKQREEYLKLRQRQNKAFGAANEGLGSWTSKRSRILSTMGATLGEAFYEKVTNLERSKHHWASRISVGKISREYNVRSAIGSGMHGVHASFGGIPGFRIHTERDAEDYLWFLNHKGQMTERGAYNAVRMNRSLEAQKLRRKHSKSVRERIIAGDEAYESDLADATGDYTWSQEKLIRRMAKTYSPDDLKKGQDRARTVLFARNHKALYKISQWLPSTSKGMMALGRNMDAMKAIGHPMITGIALGGMVVKTIDKILSEADSANAKVVSYENAAKTYGSGSRKFRYAAGLAGITNPLKQMEFYGKLTEQFGDAESGIAALGDMLPGLSQKERLFFAKSLGLSPDELAVIDIYNKTGKFKMSKSRMTNAKLGLAQLSKTYLSSSDADTFDQVSTILFGNESWAARDISNSIFSDFITTPNAVNKAAGSADYYDKTKGLNENIGNTISQHFGDVHLHGVNNPTEFANSLASEGGVAGQALQNTNTSMVV